MGKFRTRHINQIYSIMHGDSVLTFCTILHSPQAPGHIFLSLIPALRGTIFSSHMGIKNMMNIFPHIYIKKIISC